MFFIVLARNIEFHGVVLLVCLSVCSSVRKQDYLKSNDRICI